MRLLELYKNTIQKVKRVFSTKDWSTLEKGDKLYLLVPIHIKDENTEQDILCYEYQESSVINIHQYYNTVHIRFKYTNEMGKRHRVILSINKNKLNDDYVCADNRTGWATDYKISYGDLIVAFKNKRLLSDAHRFIVEQEIENCINKIKEHTVLLNYLEHLKMTK